MRRCGSPRADCTLRALVVEVTGVGEPAAVDVDICPGAIVYGLRLESTGGAAALRLADTSWSIPADHVECFDICGALFPTSAKLQTAAASTARLTVLYTQGSPSDAA